MATYSVREFKARLSEIFRGLEDGEEVTITKHGKPCGRLTAPPPHEEPKRPLWELRGAFSHLPALDYEDFVEIKKIWEPRSLPADEELSGDA